MIDRRTISLNDLILVSPSIISTKVLYVYISRICIYVDFFSVCDACIYMYITVIIIPVKCIYVLYVIVNMNRSYL